MRLLVDIGNRRVKWALAPRGEQLAGASGAFVYHPAALAAQWGSLARPHEVWVSCVASAEVRREITAYAHATWSRVPRFIAAAHRHGALLNGYAQPNTLGSDRWAALVAAAHLYPRQGVIVADVGTAVTVDVIDPDGRFRGGMIFPGLRAMTRTVAAHTAHLPELPPAVAREAFDSIATDTHAALAGGALAAVAGGVNLAVAEQQRALGGRCRVLLSGGDAAPIAALLTCEAELQPQLVLRGLAMIADDADGWRESA